MSQTYYYAHIPKTGGTSFTALLDRFFSVDEVFPERVWPRVESNHSTSNQPYRLYRGHFGGGGIKALTDAECWLMTMLRQPEDLVVSTYHFTRRTPQIMGHQLVQDENMSLTDFLQQPDTSCLASDRMTRFLSFDFQQDPAVQGVFLNQKAIERLVPLLADEPVMMAPQERLKRAWSFIQKTHWFGLLERFDDSLRLLCYQMKWPPIRQTQKLNQAAKKNTVSSQQKQLIAQLNQLDTQLYEQASQLFDQRFEAMVADLKKYQTSTSQPLDDQLDLYYQAEGNNPQEQSIDYQFDQPLKGTGWHRRQPIQGGRGQCRWTGPDASSSIDFWLKPNNYELTVEVIHAISTEVLDDLSIYANKHPLQWATEAKGVHRTIKATVSKTMIQPNGLLRLVFKLPQTKPFSELDQSKDERVVGMAISGMKLNPMN
ncbi:hypothetical protein OS175_05050 [Marinicella sp. S1101]|uniref:hypothetical protein n=1 Tax=Marinicella marina TaxID=2996016 RepID=UPI002260D23C|nr:hypothetical protein [Marinicella marina]MCX7553235.1 hypothetical protein [Marinicella marina]MDJ1138967.1 hypothetical protein [Marinicella marina]